NSSLIYPRCHFYSFYTKIDLSENFATEPFRLTSKLRVQIHVIIIGLTKFHLKCVQKLHLNHNRGVLDKL
ncbi:hypothetical protein, partial [Lactococcus cremoris]|uniref:hypothetical protein n=1 Tax=Lactococcus lactis subsp. cremoris TaxID=1359 RepID=UPI00223BE7CF